MQIILPNEIASSISGLVRESERYLIIVSPFVNFTGWIHLQHEILSAKSRGVRIIFYVRHDLNNFQSWERLQALGLETRLIKRLHAKLYLSEKSGIVTSMNILGSSVKGIEMAVSYSQDEEINILKRFVKTEIEPYTINEIPSAEDLFLSKESFRSVLQGVLSTILNSRVYCYKNENRIEITANNKYVVHIDPTNNCMWISGIVSGAEFDNFKSFAEAYNPSSVKLFAIDGEVGFYSQFQASNNHPLSSHIFEFLRVQEKKAAIEMITQFVCQLSKFNEELRLKTQRLS